MCWETTVGSEPVIGTSRACGKEKIRKDVGSSADGVSRQAHDFIDSLNRHPSNKVLGFGRPEVAF